MSHTLGCVKPPIHLSNDHNNDTWSNEHICLNKIRPTYCCQKLLLCCNSVIVLCIHLNFQALLSVEGCTCWHSLTNQTCTGLEEITVFHLSWLFPTAHTADSSTINSASTISSTSTITLHTFTSAATYSTYIIHEILWDRHKERCLNTKSLNTTSSTTVNATHTHRHTQPLLHCPVYSGEQCTVGNV